MNMPKISSKKRSSYTEANIEKTLEAFRSGMPKSKSAFLFNVPRSAIQFRLVIN